MPTDLIILYPPIEVPSPMTAEHKMCIRDRLCAQDMFNILKLPSAVKIENFSRRNLEMIEIKPVSYTHLPLPRG